MRKQSLLFLLSFLFFFCGHTCVNASKQIKKIKKTRQLQNQQTNDGKIVCVDLADFHYEIILGVTSFPEQGACSDQEEAEIAAFLQKIINAELRAIPGTIKTQNKVCSSPINSRRRLLTSSTTNGSNHESFLSSKHRHRNLYANNTTDGAEFSKRRRLTYKRHKSFIYVGGGRCRYCFGDNLDARALLPAITPTTENNRKLSSKSLYHDEENGGRDLLYVTIPTPETSLPKARDVLLCKKFNVYTLQFQTSTILPTRWTNGKKLTFVDKTNENIIHKDLWGPYLPGDNFGFQLDVDHAMRIKYDRSKQLYKRYTGKTAVSSTVGLPIKEGKIHFKLYILDLSVDASMVDAVADNHLVMFINGIKLDFNLLINQPGVQRIKTRNTEDILRGDTFAGIKWEIRRVVHKEDFAFGPEPDRIYLITITAPVIVMAHKNQMDVDFMIQPNAKAKQYAFSQLYASLKAALCEVTDLENSPFQDFKSVVESRLFHKLGMDLAREFQDKQGHCLQDKIPVVNINLVEKKTWKESNPQCNHSSGSKRY